ncbi:hypothetical protein MRX96_027492 [Rhipicephalus microplus]
MDCLPPPEPLVLTNTPADNWKKFRQRIELYFKATETNKKRTPAQKAAIFLHVAGPEAIELNRIRGRRRLAQKRPAARSDDDDFLGEAKSSAASAKPTAPRYRAASSNAVGQVPSVCASSEPPTSSQWEQQTGECGTDETKCEDLRDKLNRIRRRRPLKPNRRERPSNADLRERCRGVADEGLSSSAKRRATFLCHGRAGKARRRNAPFRYARRLRTYVDLDRPAEEFWNDDECNRGFLAPHYWRYLFRAGSGTSAVGELQGQREAYAERRT